MKCRKFTLLGAMTLIVSLLCSPSFAQVNTQSSYNQIAPNTWYYLKSMSSNTAARATYCLKAATDGGAVTAVSDFPPQKWKIVERSDKSYNIVNELGYYLQDVTTGHTVSSTPPAKGFIPEFWLNPAFGIHVYNISGNQYLQISGTTLTNYNSPSSLENLWKFIPADYFVASPADGSADQWYILRNLYSISTNLTDARYGKYLSTASNTAGDQLKGDVGTELHAWRFIANGNSGNITLYNIQDNKGNYISTTLNSSSCFVTGGSATDKFQLSLCSSGTAVPNYGYVGIKIIRNTNAGSANTLCLNQSMNFVAYDSNSDPSLNWEAIKVENYPTYLAAEGTDLLTYTVAGTTYGCFPQSARDAFQTVVSATSAATISGTTISEKLTSLQIIKNAYETAKATYLAAQLTDKATLNSTASVTKWFQLINRGYFLYSAVNTKPSATYNGQEGLALTSVNTSTVATPFQLAMPDVNDDSQLWSFVTSGTTITGIVNKATGLYIGADGKAAASAPGSVTIGAILNDRGSINITPGGTLPLYAKAYIDNAANNLTGVLAGVAGSGSAWMPVFIKSTTTGVEEVSADNLGVKVQNHIIFVTGTESYQVYNVSGQEMKREQQLPDGLYIVKSGYKVAKVMVAGH